MVVAVVVVLRDFQSDGGGGFTAKVVTAVACVAEAMTRPVEFGLVDHVVGWR